MNTPVALAGIVGDEAVGTHPALGDTPVAFPREEPQCVELLRLAARDSLKVQLVGAGSKLCWTTPARGIDFALCTRELSGIVEFEAGDGTLTARAGSSLAELNETVGAAGLELTPDVPRPAEVTLGGVIAAGQSGPDRLRHGPARMHLLGTRTLLAGGEVTRSGGRLVKNATGYDLHRLFCGSLGTLGLILDVSLRLVTRAESTVVVSRTYAKLEGALAAAAGLRAVKVEPRVVTVENRLGEQPAEPWGLHLVLAGRAAQLDVELERLEPLLPAATRTEGAEARARTERLRDLEPDPRDGPVLHLAVRPSRLGRAAALLFEALGESPEASAVLQPGVATLELHPGSALEDPARLREVVTRAREALAPLGARLAVRGAVLGKLELEPLGASGAALALERRLRAALDPRGVLAGGRFSGGR